MDNPDLAQSIGRLEGKMDLVLEGMQQHFKDDKVQFEGLHKKVEGLKNKWAFVAGATAIVTFAISNTTAIQGLFSLLPK